MRRGVTPVVAVAILMGMAVVVAGAAYGWMTMIQQDTLDEASEQVQFELTARDITCRNDLVTVTLDNTGGRELSGAAVSAYLYHNGELLGDNDTDLSGKNFLQANGVDTASFNFSTVMAKNEAYTVEISFTRDSYTYSTRCQADGGFVHGTQYGREITVTNSHSGDLDGFPASVTLDTATLISNGKMQSDCSDIRVEEDGDPVPHNITSCNTGSTTVHFATDVAASSTEDDVYLYYGDASLQDAQEKIPSRILNGDFSAGSFVGWNHRPRNPGGSPTEWWIDDWPNDGTCVTPSGGDNGPCGRGAATISVLGSASGDAVCSPGSGCPTSVLGDGNLALDGGQDGGGYNGNIHSDAYTVPGDVHIHYWTNLEGRSSDGKYGGATWWYGTQNATSLSCEGTAQAVAVDRDGTFTEDSQDLIVNYTQGCGSLGASTHSVDVSWVSGEPIRIYLEQNQGGGGDDGLIQVDDLYWSDSAGNEITLSTSLGPEIQRP